MKKLNKLFAILFAVLGVQTLSAQEWTDKTSLLVNPSFESQTGASNLTSGWGAPTEGWTLTPSAAPANSQAGVAASSCTIQGIATTLPTADKGNYFYVRTNWNNDVTFSLKQEVTGDLPAGLYRVTCMVASNSGNWPASKFNLTLKEGDNTSTNSSLNKCSEWTEWSVDLYKKEASTNLTIEATMYPGSSGSGQHYQLLLDNFKLEYKSLDDIEASEWPKPQIPSSNIKSFVGTGIVAALYNVGSDAFVTRGMTWGTQAIATKLHNSDSQTQATSDRHHVKISAGDNGKIRFSVNGKNYLGDGAQGSTTTVYTDNGNTNTNQFIYSEFNEGTYRLKVGNATSDIDAFLDVSQPYGGQLTYANGQGFTEWAIIKFSDIENGKYALYKAKKAMYEVYKAVVDAGHSATYSDALSTALETYIKPNATASDVTAATNVLIKAVSPALTAGYVNAGALFNNPDMRGAGSKDKWTSGYTNVSWGVFENYHNGNNKLTQTKTVPNGFYKVVFHGIWRQDGSNAAPTLTLRSGDKSVSANVPCMTDIAFGVGNTNGSNNWTTNGGKIIPNGMQSAGEGLSHRDAQVTISDFVVSDGQLTIEMNSSSTSQWILAQGFDIYFKAESMEEYANLFNEAKAAADAIDVNTLNTYAKNILTTALNDAATEQINKEWYQARTAELNAAVALANEIKAPYANLNPLIDLCTEYTSTQNSNANSPEVLSAFQEAISAATEEGNNATSADAINTAYNNLESARRNYAKNAVPVYPYPFDMTFLLPNTTFDKNIDGWTKTGSANWMNAGNVECYDNTFEFSMEYSGLNKGSWEIQVDAFYRYGGYNDAEAAHNDETEQLYAILYANNNEVAVKSIMEGANKAGSVGATTNKGLRVPNAPGDCGAYFATGCYSNSISTVIADGKLKVGIKKEETKQYDWTIFDNFKLIYKGVDVSELQKSLSSLITTAQGIQASKMGTKEKEALDEALETADVKVTIADDLSEMISTLQSAYDAAKASTETYSKVPAYIEKANKIDKSIAGSYQTQYEEGTIEGNAKDVFQNLEVATYQYVMENFNYPVKLSTEWNKEGPVGELSDQHWSGEKKPYLEQSSTAWSTNAWEISYDQDLTLPAGEYVFKVAGRKASGNGCTLSLIVTKEGEELGTVNDFPEGDTGHGITVNGWASFSADSAYANNNVGRGWQWRYVKFTLDSDATVNIAVKAQATTSYQWISFCDATVQMTEETYLKANKGGLDAPTAAANDLVDSKPMGTAENQALRNALDLPVETGAELLAKIAALEKAVKEANTWREDFYRTRAESKLVESFERFETDFNDGANGALRKMSDENWTKLLEAVKTAAIEKDVTNNYDNFATAAKNFNEAMDAAEFDIAAYLIETQNGNATGLIKNADFTGGTISHAVQGSGGGVKSPTEWDFKYTFEGWNDASIIDENGTKVFNVWCGKMDGDGAYAELTQEIYYLPNGTYKLSAEMVTKANTDGSSWVAIYAAPLDENGGLSYSNIARSKNVTQGEEGTAYNNYEVCFKVENNAAVVGVRTDKRYFKIKNIKLEKVKDAAAEVDNGILLQKAFENRSATSWDITSIAPNASGAEIYLNNPNAIVYANDGQVQWPNTVVDGKAASFTLTEGNAFYSDRDFAATTLNYNRELSDNWLTVCLPFDYTIPEGVKVETLSEIDTETKTFTFDEETETMTANTPYIIKNSTEEAALFASLINASVEATPAEAMKVIVDGIDAEFVGTYTTKTSTELMEITDDAAKYDILFFGTDGQLYYLSQGVTTKNITFKPFRAYIRLPKGAINWSDGQQARVRHRNSEMTDIDTLESEDDSQKTTVIYDMHGRRVTEMVKGGMYIVNGKKVVIK